jgi:antitoxin component YwqK of YwqJK toxin-antitoxin module
MKLTLMLFLFSFCVIVNIVGQEKTWIDSNGEITTKEKATFYRLLSSDKKDNQLLTIYDVSGNKTLESYLINGKKDGKSLEFYVTGEVKTTGDFKVGLKEGLWKTYYENGKIREKGKYAKGEKIGVWKTYYKND